MAESDFASTKQKHLVSLWGRNNKYRSVAVVFYARLDTAGMCLRSSVQKQLTLFSPTRRGWWGM